MENELKPKFKTDGPIVRALFERALADPPKKKKVEEGPLAPKFKTDGPIVRALFERALAGPPKKKTKVEDGPVADPAPKK
jgi:hypothetical protein